MNGKDIWEKSRHAIQARQLAAMSALEFKSAKVLWAEISKLLHTASDDGVLKTKKHELQSLLKTTPQPKQGKNVRAVMVGAEKKNFRRSQDLPHIARSDGAWFDFSILVDETKKPAAIIGFDFEIRFPDSQPIPFLRYDLNTPGHNNQDDGLRFHIHPGHDDVMIHSAPMSPLEILQQFLYGLPIPSHPRKF